MRTFAIEKRPEYILQVDDGRPVPASLGNQWHARQEGHQKVEVWSRDVYRHNVQPQQQLKQKAEEPLTGPPTSSASLNPIVSHVRCLQPSQRSFNLPSDYLTGIGAGTRSGVFASQSFRSASRGTPTASHHYQSARELAAARKRDRRLLTPEQTSVLYKLLQKTHFPTTEVREAVAKQLGISPRKVQVWFQNRRQVGKKQMVEAAQAAKKEMTAGVPIGTRRQMHSKFLVRQKTPIRSFFTPASGISHEDERTRAWREQAVMSAITQNKQDEGGHGSSSDNGQRLLPSMAAERPSRPELPQAGLTISVPRPDATVRGSFAETPLLPSVATPKTAPIAQQSPPAIRRLSPLTRRESIPNLLPPLSPPSLGRARSNTTGRITLPPLRRPEAALPSPGVSPRLSPMSGQPKGAERFSPYRIPVINERPLQKSESHSSLRREQLAEEADQRSPPGTGNATLRLPPPVMNRSRSVSDPAALFQYPTSCLPGSRLSTSRSFTPLSGHIDNVEEVLDESNEPVSSSPTRSTKSFRTLSISSHGSRYTPASSISTSPTRAESDRPLDSFTSSFKTLDRFERASERDASTMSSLAPGSYNQASPPILAKATRGRLRSVSEIKFHISLNDDDDDANMPRSASMRETQPRFSPMDVRAMTINDD